MVKNTGALSADFLLSRYEPPEELLAEPADAADPEAEADAAEAEGVEADPAEADAAPEAEPEADGEVVAVTSAAEVEELEGGESTEVVMRSK